MFGQQQNLWSELRRPSPELILDALVGYNMSLRRTAFDRFEATLRPYWNLFEVDACFQVKEIGRAHV